MEDDAPIKPGEPEEPEAPEASDLSAADFSGELEHLAVIEAELAQAEAELEALEAPAHHPEAAPTQ